MSSQTKYKLQGMMGMGLITDDRKSRLEQTFCLILNTLN